MQAGGSRGRRRGAVAAVLGFALLGGPAGARAQPAPAPSSAQIEEARDHYNRGRRLAEEGSVDGAIREIQRAYEIAPSSKLLYNLALLKAEHGEHAEALALFERYLEEGGADVPAERQREVAAAIKRLRDQVARIDLRSDTTGVEILIDGHPGGVTPFVRSIAVEAGRHRVVARYRGVAVLVQGITVVAGDSVTLSVELASGGAHASTDLAEAEAELAAGRFEEARAIAERLALQGKLDHEQFVRETSLLGAARALTDDPSGARTAYAQLLAADPTHPPPAADKAREAFVGARDAWPHEPAVSGVDVSVSLDAVGEGRARVTVRDPTHVVARVAAGYRWGPSSPFTVIHAAGSSVVVPIGAPPPAAFVLQYYAQAIDAHDDVVFELGTEANPKSTMRPALPAATAGVAADRGASRGRPLLESPWFWGVAAAVVAAGAGGIYVAARRSSGPTSAALAPGLQCGDARCE